MPQVDKQEIVAGLRASLAGIENESERAFVQSTIAGLEFDSVHAGVSREYQERGS